MRLGWAVLLLGSMCGAAARGQEPVVKPQEPVAKPHTLEDVFEGVTQGAGTASGQEPRVTGSLRDTRAKDATEAFPANYKLVLGNDKVRVVHVHYGPGEHIPVHNHPAVPMVWLYLNDAGPVLFNHVDGDGSRSPVKRPAVRVGDMRLGAGHEPEVHSVRNLSDTATDFMRIELVGLPPGLKGIHGRLPESGEEFRVEDGRVSVFDNPRLRIVRWAVAAGQTRRLEDKDATVWLAVDAQGAKVGGAVVEAGQVWVNGPVEVTAGERAAEFLEVIER